MAVLLGLAAALTYGGADFVGGLASRRAGALRVVVLSQLAGLATVLVTLPLVATSRPSAAALGWGAASGIAGGLGVALLYRALAAGQMSVVAPVTAVEAAAVPVLWGLATGEQPGAAALAGIGLALAAVVLVSAAPESAPVAAGPAVPALPRRSLLSRPGLRDALGAGAAFGAFFLLLDRAGTTTLQAGLWPVFAARVASVSMLLGVALLRRRSLRPPRDALALIVVAGVLDMAANLLYLLATGRGLLSVVAVLTSLYPASTVLLARVVLRERLAGSQRVGLVAALAGVVLIAQA